MHRPALVSAPRGIPQVVGPRLSVAPMMNVTDRHFRVLMRGITTRTWLYTEMLTTASLLQDRGPALLQVEPVEPPLVLQLGGDDPSALARCATMARRRAYAELNLNVGCPSASVRSGGFGAALMLRPARVADCVRAMSDAFGARVTVKHRLGVDGRESFQSLIDFVGAVAAAGAARFIVHARVARLSGLSPRQNRQVPPLRPDWVHALKGWFPHVPIEINGEIRSLAQAERYLHQLDGVMIGRAAREAPMLFADVDSRVSPERVEPPTRRQVVRRYRSWLSRELVAGTSPLLLLRPLQHLYSGCPGARRWRRALARIDRHSPGDTIVRQLDDAIDEVERLHATARSHRLGETVCVR
ncbi:MAG: tRNA dihydrouridine(20/20a) synthase DusA [Myxococcales bacterium FL481]|nr:MAG: tRNA dihydrouridine(20/20a) synthase DusA [Myxococcales bacterium FL481]